MQEKPPRGRLRLTKSTCSVRERAAIAARKIHPDEWFSIRIVFPPGRSELLMKTYSSWTLAVAAAVGVCALAGCNQRESANETAQDVSEARQDAQENVAEERREAAGVATEGAEDRAAAEYDVAVAQADGARTVAKEKCETLGSDAQKACKDQADATYESAKAQAQATLDASKRSGSAEPAPATP
jgi:hypothetical protein